jgi:hypothetical protein
MLPVLRLLGYDLEYQRAAVQVGGATFTISHRAGDEECAPRVHIVAHDQDRDRRGDARQSPHALVQDYLNRSDCLWGIVTSGDASSGWCATASVPPSRPMSSSTSSRWSRATCTARSSSPSGSLSTPGRPALPTRTSGGSSATTSRTSPRAAGCASASAREGFHALRTLGRGFLGHSGSAKLRDAFGTGAIDEPEYYRQLLRLVYRLLFLMVAEERQLLLVLDGENVARQRIYTDWYSITRLRQLAERRFTGDRHSDLFDGLKQTFFCFVTRSTLRCSASPRCPRVCSKSRDGSCQHQLVWLEVQADSRPARLVFSHKQKNELAIHEGQVWLALVVG